MWIGDKVLVPLKAIALPLCLPLREYQSSFGEKSLLERPHPFGVVSRGGEFIINLLVSHCKPFASCQRDDGLACVPWGRESF